MDRVFGWLFAVVIFVAVILVSAFEHPAFLPREVHAFLLSKGLAKPLPPQETVAAATRPAGGQGGQQVRAVPVEAVRVTVGRVSSTLTAVGTLTSDERIDVASEMEGKVVEIGFQEGSDVKAGDILFKLDDQTQRAALSQAMADQSLAEANFERADALSKQKIGTDKARDEAKFALEKVRANVLVAQVNLDRTVIRASFAGRTSLRKVSVGGYITRGQILVGLQRIDPIKVDFRLPEVDLTNITIGGKITIELDAMPGKRFTGEVYAVDPQLDVNGRAIQLRATVENKSGELRPGLFARVLLTTDDREQAITVPESAIITQGRDRFVYVVRDDKAARTKVTTGIRLPGKVEISQGLKPNDMVVVSGQQRLRDGAAVDVVGTGPTS